MTIKKAHIIGFFFSSLLGALLHFVFEWSGGSPLVGALTPVNESTWEHLKLLAMPMLLFAIAEHYSYGRRTPGFLSARAVSILLGMGVIICGYYTYKGVWGQDVAAVNIILFVAGVLAAYCYSYKALRNRRCHPDTDNRAKLGIALLLILFVVFTFYPPHIGLFLDPLTGGYGIIR